MEPPQQRNAWRMENFGHKILERDAVPIIHLTHLTPFSLENKKIFIKNKKKFESVWGLDNSTVKVFFSQLVPQHTALMLEICQLLVYHP